MKLGYGYVTANKLTIMSVQDFARDYADNVKDQSIYYAIQHNKVDYTQVGRQYFIVLTDRTKEYKPNESVKRA